MPDFATSSPQGLMELAWLTLLHSAWLGVLVGVFAASIVALGRPASGRTRHAAIVTALVVAAIAAPAAAVAQRFWDRRPTISSVVTMMRSSTEAEGQAVTGPPPHPATSPATAPAHRGRALAGLAFGAAASLLDATRPYLMIGWAAGASAFAGVMAVGGLSLRRLIREAVPCPDLDRRARVFGRLLRLRRTPAVRRHPGITEPCLAGMARPMILLPSDWLASAAVAEVDAVLAHELAHARRRDPRTNLLLRLIEAAFGYSPGVRLASRLARREAERAADALAVRITGDPRALARALESVARSQKSPHRLARPGLAVGGDRDPSALLPRIQELLGMKPARPRFPFRLLAALPAAVALAIVATSASPAEEPTPPANVQDHVAPVLSGTLSKEEFLNLFHADPATLSREDLIKRLDAVRGPVANVDQRSREDLIREAASSQVSFQIRFVHIVDVEQDPFDALRQGKPQAGERWVVEAPELEAVLKAAMSTPRSHALQAPKVSAQEGAAVVVSEAPSGKTLNVPDAYYEVDGEPEFDQGPLIVQPSLDDWRSSLKRGPDGKLRWFDAWRVDVRATRTDAGSRVSATLTTRVLDPRFQRSAKDNSPHPVVAEPRGAVLKAPVECDVPAGASLVIPSGFQGRWPGAYFALPRLVRGYAVVTPTWLSDEEIQAAALARIEEAARKSM